MGRQIILNPQPIGSCDIFSSNSGGNVLFSWRYIQFNGLPETNCHPFNLTAPCIDNNCTKYYIMKNSQKVFYGEDEIRNEIIQNGPVAAILDIGYDIGNYRSGIYKSVLNTEESSFQHAVVIYGWGSEGGIPYWLVQNSYGTKWGINGTMKIYRGKNHCGIESFASSAKIKI